MYISSGMFGMIVVEPKVGLPKVDREFYFGQHEIYTNKPTSTKGHHGSTCRPWRPRTSYVVFDGEKASFTPDRYGPVTAKQDETVRVFMVAVGPNLTSIFYPIGNVWSTAYPQGALASTPMEYVQTPSVPPGSCFVSEMDLPVPVRIKLVNHALSRVTRKGLVAAIDVNGEKRTDIFDPRSR